MEKMYTRVTSGTLERHPGATARRWTRLEYWRPQ